MQGLASHQLMRAQVELPAQSVGALLRERVEFTPDRDFLIAPGCEDETYSFRAFLDAVERAQTRLVEWGLERGDRVGLLVPNSSDFLIAYFACLDAGMTVVPINPDLASREISYILTDSRAKLLIHHPTLAARIPELGIRSEDVGELRTGEAVPGIPADVDPQEDAVILYTSGTTGNPKGVVLQHLSLLADADAIAEWFGFDANTRTLCILPLFHNNAQVVTLLAPLSRGGSTVIVHGKVVLSSFWPLVERWNVTWTSVMPSILSILLRYSEPASGTPLQGIICGGQVLTSSVQQKFEDTFGVPIFEGFGLTETTSFACFNAFPREKRRPGSIGRALPCCEIRVLDDDGSPVPIGEKGELCVRGPNLCREYLGLPERNELSFRDGWFRTGDYGYQDADGWLYFLCRHDFLIIKGGENIYPAEIENVLFEHPAISDCAVLGVPDDLLGEEVCAFVKTRDPGLDPQALRKHLKGRIAPFKQPKKVFLIHHLSDLDEIPKGPTKKVLYRKLHEYYMEKLR